MFNVLHVNINKKKLFTENKYKVMKRSKLSTVGKLDSQLRTFFELQNPTVIESTELMNNYLFDVLDYIDLRILIFDTYGVKIPLQDLKGASSLHLLSGLINHYVAIKQQDSQFSQAS